MHGSEAVGGQCKTSERSAPGKALKGHTFKEFAVRAIVDCQNTCERDPRCASYNFYIPGKVCELNSHTITWDQALFSFRFENHIPAGKAKRKESLIQTFNEMSAAHFFDWLTFAESANQNYFRCLFF